MSSGRRLSGGQLDHAGGRPRKVDGALRARLGPGPGAHRAWSGHASEEGETSGSVSGVSASYLAVLGARFTVAGRADNGCAGSITIIIDDVNPLLTVLGGGGLLLALVGALVVLAAMRGEAGVGKRIVSAIFGLLGGVGAALAAEQFRLLDPTQPIGLIIAIAAAVIGLLTAGIFGGGGGETEAAPPTPSRPASDDTQTYPSGVGGGSAG
ncbi:MAG TPA: hypothetical protein VNL94_03835 [Candidatus Binatia bacterium]|nr:hypothetical protein [Candidatus Binatia bacterium]